MGKNIFKNAATGIRNSPFIIPIGFIFISMLVVSTGLIVEDYTTSYLGYQAIPTNKANIWVIYLVALLPQVLQMGFGYVFLDDSEKRWAITVVFLALFIDVATDVMFKATGLNYTIIIAILESLLLYTLGSELMFTVAFGVFVQILPDFGRQLAKFFSSISEMLSHLFQGLISKDDDFRLDDTFSGGKRGRGRPRKKHKRGFTFFDGRNERREDSGDEIFGIISRLDRDAPLEGDRVRRMDDL